jgi:hypothetical protein
VRDVTLVLLLQKVAMISDVGQPIGEFHTTAKALPYPTMKKNLDGYLGGMKIHVRDLLTILCVKPLMMIPALSLLRQMYPHPAILHSGTQVFIHAAVNGFSWADLSRYNILPDRRNMTLPIIFMYITRHPDKEAFVHLLSNYCLLDDILLNSNVSWWWMDSIVDHQVVKDFLRIFTREEGFSMKSKNMDDNTDNVVVFLRFGPFHTYFIYPYSKYNILPPWKYQPEQSPQNNYSSIISMLSCRPAYSPLVHIFLVQYICQPFNPVDEENEVKCRPSSLMEMIFSSSDEMEIAFGLLVSHHIMSNHGDSVFATMLANDFFHQLTANGCASLLTTIFSDINGVILHSRDVNKYWGYLVLHASPYQLLLHRLGIKCGFEVEMGQTFIPESRRNIKQLVNERASRMTTVQQLVMTKIEPTVTSTDDTIITFQSEAEEPEFIMMY